RRGAQVPNDRLRGARREAQADQLVEGPRSDVGRGQVTDVVHVEAEQRAEVGLGEELLRAREPLTAEAVEVDALLPVDSHRAVGASSHQVFLPISSSAVSTTRSGVGTVSSSSGGEKGMGASVAPMRRTGAARGQTAPSAIAAASSAEAP